MKSLLLVLFCVAIAGCGGGESSSPAAAPSTVASTTGNATYIASNTACTAIMNDVLAKSGAPEEIKNFDTNDGYHDRAWWYWSRGFQYSFTWAPYVDGCKVSTYTFAPIKKQVSPNPPE